MNPFSEDELKLFRSIDLFIRRLNDKVYEFGPGATKLSFREKVDGWVSTKTLSDGLAEALHQYEVSKGNAKARIKAAETADLWIKRALTSNCIETRQDLVEILESYVRQLESYKTQSSKLQEENQKLYTECKILQGKYEECQRSLLAINIGNTQP
jgi:hypothetical protein